MQDSDQAICQLMEAADPPTVRAHLRERAEALNPELGRDAERRAHARRGFTADEVGNGVVLGGALGVEDGQVLLHGLDLAVRGDRADGDSRTLPQRRANVLVQWARQAADEAGDPAGGVREDLRTARTQLLLSCTAEQLARAARIAGLGGHGKRPGLSSENLADAVTGRSAAGAATAAEHQPDGRAGSWPWTPAGPGCAGAPDSSRVPAGGSFGPGALVSSEALRRLVCDASVSLVVHADSTAPLDAGEHDDVVPNPLGIRRDPRRRGPPYVGRAARIVNAAQWRALVARDRRCVVKGCRRRPLQCEAHHVKHWLDGGRTDLDNLVLLCFQHHQEHHDRRRSLQHHDGRWITHTGWGAQAPP